MICDLMEIYKALLERYGVQGWWPGEGGFETMVGAVLTQNTNWGNVEKALQNLKEARVLTPEAIDDMAGEELAQLIKPAGYYNIKARRLKNLVGWFRGEYDGSIAALQGYSIEQLREELLGINGVGRETADSIILYAVGKCTFVVDSYTCRVLVRHGCIEAECTYDEVKEFCENRLPVETGLYNEFHALLVQVGKNHCKVRAQCSNCPLERFEHIIEA
ncbi:endonuclease III domain-containing protein [Planctomycetota bacterium]